jgi:Glycosyltransferase family 87
MATVSAKRASGWSRRSSLLELLGFSLLAAIVGWSTWRAIADPHAYDFRLYYRAGQVAWATGHPEHQSTWDGTPLLAALMAILTRIASLRTGADLITVLNAAVVVGAAAVVLRRLRGVLPVAAWWAAAAGLLSFGPILSTIWWKQFNLIALAAALMGFALLRQRRTARAAVLIGLSVSIKPLAFLLPLVLLARPSTRRIGALAVAWAAGLNLAGQALLAIRAHDPAALSPVLAVQNFLTKSKPDHIWACQPINFAPGSALCRLVGRQDPTLQHLAVWVAVAVLAAWIVSSLRGRGVSSWETFAFTCPLSVMVSPLAWAHYQVMLAPLFVLLLVRFTRDGAGPIAWAGLAGAFVLASLMWLPYGTLPDAARQLLSGHTVPRGQVIGDENGLATAAQGAQYLLILTGVLWYRGQRRGERPQRTATVRLR